MQYYAIVGEGPWQEVLVTRQPYPDGRVNQGMRLVGQEPTGATYGTWRSATQAIGERNRAIVRARYGR